MSEQDRKELEHYRRLFSTSDHDAAIDGYISYVRLVRQQIDYLKNFNISSHIDGKKTETVLYDRSIALWESMPEMISKMQKLKIELKIDFDPTEGKPKQQALRPELLAQNHS